MFRNWNTISVRIICKALSIGRDNNRKSFIIFRKSLFLVPNFGARLLNFVLVFIV